MLVPGHVVSLYVATCGYNGAALGSDEKEIVLLIYVIIDVQTNNIVGVKQYFVRPSNPQQGREHQNALHSSSASQNNISSSQTSLDQSIGTTCSSTQSNNSTSGASSATSSSGALPEYAISQEIPAIESLIQSNGRPLEEVLEQLGRPQQDTWDTGRLGRRK